ncbi:MAG: amidohydrolase family protein [Myxococcota bacterium]
MLITGAEIGGRAPLDLRCAGGRIDAIAASLSPEGDEEVIHASGGALLPGLHDHHIHLLALAAALRSVRCGPPQVNDRAALARALAEARPQKRWIRGVGYHESVAGELDRWVLDTLVSARPLRIQHRSGAMWILNSAAVEILGLDDDGPSGVERDLRGHATGRLFRCDRWLRERLDDDGHPNLAEAGRLLASFGVTGLTDAGPANTDDDLDEFIEAVVSGALPQRLQVMGSPSLSWPDHPRVSRGAVKVLLDDCALPSLDELEATVAEAHRQDRGVAIHCVTRVQLVLAARALESAGAGQGDRIEHASVAPPEVVTLLSRLPLTVVTQPGFVYERGDVYLGDVEHGELPWLYRCRGFIEAGIALAAGTDAPFGEPDPWLAMRAAVRRRTRAGAELGPEEALDPEQALALFTSSAQAPGAAPRRLGVGEPADLCLLDRPWAEAREELSASMVRATVCRGRLVWTRPG